MKNRKDVIVLVLIGISIVGALFYLDVENSLLGVFVAYFTTVNYDEVHPRNIVKNAIPILLLERDNNSCKVYADKFLQIVDHAYFIRSQELINQLQYNHDDKTLILSCDQISGEKSKLHIWYVVSESDVHAKKFSYWITPWIESTS